MNKNKHQIPLFLIIAVFVAGFIANSVLSALMASWRISSTATVKTVGCSVWLDTNATIECTNIEWGAIEPDQTVTRLVYVRNDGNVPSTLTLTTNNWQPINTSDFMTFSTSYDGETINPQSVLGVTLHLYVHADIAGITNFSFDITVSASG